MSARSCPRLFEAEALRDGRLTGSKRASFQRHATACVACAREVQALSAVAAAVFTSLPPAADELRVRRERTRLLAAFDRKLVAPSRASAARRWAFGFAAIVALTAAVLVVQGARRGERAAGSVEPRRALIHADRTAAWSERIEGDREVVFLERGVLWIHIDHAGGSRRLVVVLPDGELEDTGTTFTVSALASHTTRVAVREGSVVLRLRGQSPVALGPGEAWTPASQSVALIASSPSSEPALQAPSPPAPAPAPSSSNEFAPPPLSVRGPRSRAASVAEAPASDPSIEFRQAVSALQRGDDRGAAAGFAEFLANHPHDPHAEDAAYLRIIALQRHGDRDGMRAAASSYLRLYPTGFRHAEVESLSQ
jgi:hypothetical protein